MGCGGRGSSSGGVLRLVANEGGGLFGRKPEIEPLGLGLGRAGGNSGGGR